ncbi:MAG: hypothetical protein ACRDOS_12205, partial [Gaiellaceae bacterium]
MSDERSEVGESGAETGFGTGLRTKLGRGATPLPGNGEASEAGASANGTANEAEVIALRAELAAAMDRERGLRAEVAAALVARSDHD